MGSSFNNPFTAVELKKLRKLINCSRLLNDVSVADYEPLYNFNYVQANYAI